jgi:hypothetical protein
LHPCKTTGKITLYVLIFMFYVKGRYSQFKKLCHKKSLINST